MGYLMVGGWEGIIMGPLGWTVKPYRLLVLICKDSLRNSSRSLHVAPQGTDKIQTLKGSVKTLNDPKWELKVLIKRSLYCIRIHAIY